MVHHVGHLVGRMAHLLPHGETMRPPNTHCDACRNRFMGEDRILVTMKSDRKVKKEVKTIHKTCFSPRRMVKV